MLACNEDSDRATKGARSESSLQASIVYTALRMGFLVTKLRAHGRRGIPDLLVISPGGCVGFIEVKAPNGRLSPLQEVFINRLRSRNQHVIVVFNLDSAVEFLERLLCPAP
jgi:hypothetical protein